MKRVVLAVIIAVSITNFAYADEHWTDQYRRKSLYERYGSWHFRNVSPAIKKYNMKEPNKDELRRLLEDVEILIKVDGELRPIHQFVIW